MADGWLDDLKEKDTAENADERRRQDSQLHNDRTIRAKAPEFWRALVEHVRADCVRLQSHRPARHARVVRERANHSFVLERKQLPVRAVALELNLDGRFIRSVKSITNEFGQGSSPETEQINIKVEDGGSLVFESQDGEIRTVPDFARYLFGFVLELDE